MLLPDTQAKGPVPASMVSTFLEKKDDTETSKQEEEIIGNVAFTVYADSCLDESDHTVYTFTQSFHFIAGSDTVSSRFIGQK